MFACIFVSAFMLLSVIAAPPVMAQQDYQDITDQDEQAQEDLQNDVRTPEFDEKIKRDLTEMTRQLTASAIISTSMIGSFFDAKHQMEVQTLMDKFYVEAERSYRPSVPLCKFGTVRRGLISSDFRSTSNTSVLAKGAIDRDMRNIARFSFDAGQMDMARVVQFKNRYCNPDNLDGTLGGIPAQGTNPAVEGICPPGASSPDKHDLDINYTRMLDNNLTLDINFTDNVQTDDEIDVHALMSNLYSYDTFPVLSVNYLRDPGNYDTIMKMRSVNAARSLARNSFVHIVGNKALGTGVADSFIRDMMRAMGYNDAALDDLIGDDPSYEAQMEFITKKIFQQPNFIVSLIDTPENVKRQENAILASKLMLDRDIVQALHRREILISAILNELLKDEEDFLQKNLRPQ